LYPLSLIVLAFFLYEQKLYFIVGILLLAISDAAAGLIGRFIAKDKKTDVGSVVFFIVSFIILLTGFGVVDALFVALILAFVERISPYGFDNLTIPLAYLFMLAVLI
jgi:phytol kinase